MAVKVYLSLNANPRSIAFGKYYAYADNEKPIGIDELSRHMAEHNTPYSKGAIRGIITDMVSCIRELNLQGIPVKLDNLAIFSAHIENKGGWQKLEDVSMSVGGTTDQIQAIRLCARATGDFTKKELSKYGTVEMNREWRRRVADAKRAAGQEADSGNP